MERKSKMKLNVNLGKDSYPIYIEQGILNKTKELSSQVFTITPNKGYEIASLKVDGKVS